MPRGLFFVFLSVATLLVHATEARQDFDSINTAVKDFLQNQLASYGDHASFEIGRIDNRLILAACAKLDVELPSGNRLVGNTSLRVKCAKGARWTVNVPVAIAIQTDYWVAARPLTSGHEVVEGDIEKRTGNMAELPPTVVFDATQAIGRTMMGGAPVGAPLRSDQLHAPFAIKSNDIVKVLAHGNGFEVTSEGHALGNANIGQTVSVKMSSGAVVQGIAREGGLVEIKY
jgi:flagella basal body P-ring formation protein FlgA